MALPEITIIRDTREQKGWIFEPEEKKPGKIRVLGTEVGTLDAADYSVKGYESLIRIERKNGFAELFCNMSPKAHKERFEREMEKLRDIPYKYLIIETVLSDDALCLSVPQMYKGPPSSSVLKWIYELEMEYGIVPIFANDAGKRTARYLIELAIKRING